MATVTRKADRKARVTLFNDFADHLLLIERLSDEEIRIRKAKTVPKSISLRELLAKITPENLHPEVSTGPARGREEL